MNLLQLFMTGFLAIVGYFLLVAFTAFEYHDMNTQMIYMIGVGAGSFLVVRKVFAS